MKRVIIESPFRPLRADECRPWTRYAVLKQNIIYARLALLDSLNRDESPFASHLLYPQVYSEDQTFRERGIEAGLAQYAGAQLVAFYVDLGWSDGMRNASARCNERRIDTDGRSLFQHLKPGLDVRYHLATLPLEDWPLLEQLRAEALP